MRDLVLSEQVRRVVASLSPQKAAELSEILYHIDSFLPALQRAGYVIEYRWYGLNCLRYADDAFPFMILFSPIETQSVLAVHMIIAATL